MFNNKSVHTKSVLRRLRGKGDSVNKKYEEPTNAAVQKIKKIVRDKEAKAGKKRKLDSKRRFVTPKMRKLHSSHQRANNKKHVLSDQALRHHIDSVIEHARNGVDRAELAAELRAAHIRTTAACVKSDKVLEQLIPLSREVSNYSGVITRSTKKVYGGTHLLIALANALRNCLAEIDKMHDERVRWSERYMEMLVQLEALGRIDSDLSGGSTGVGALVLKSEEAPRTKGELCGSRWAVRYGNGTVGEMRSSAQQTDEQKEMDRARQYLSCTVARSRNMHEHSLDGELLFQEMHRQKNRRLKQRTSKTRSVFEDKLSGILQRAGMHTAPAIERGNEATIEN